MEKPGPNRITNFPKRIGEFFMRLTNQDIIAAQEEPAVPELKEELLSHWRKSVRSERRGVRLSRDLHALERRDERVNKRRDSYWI
jgi:hypothetical protein